MPDQVSRLLLGKAKGPRAPLESVAGDRLRLIEPDAATDLERLTDSFHLNLTAFGLLSFFVGLFIVNSAVGIGLRAAAADAADAAVVRRLGAHAQHGARHRAGDARDRGRPCRARLRLCHRGSAVARCRGLAARALRRADPRTSRAEARMVAGRHRHQRVGRARRFRREPDQGGPPARAGVRAAAGLATGASTLAEMAGRCSRFHLCARRIADLARRLPARGICRTGGAAAGRGAAVAQFARTRADARRAWRATAAGVVVLGRQPPATVRPVAGADGAVAGACRQCRRRHHGAKF